MPVLAPLWQRPEVLQAIFDQLSDALFLYDKDLGVTGVNQAAQRLFGMSADEMVGRHANLAAGSPKEWGKLPVSQRNCTPAYG